MFIVQAYTFTLGGAGLGTITIPATLKLEDFGVITNVSRGSILYDPVEGSAGATVSYDGGDTILTLEQGTTYCNSADNLQIIVLQGGGGGSEPAADVHVTNTALDPVNILGSVTVTNDPENPASVQVENWPASVEVSNDVGNPLPVTGLVTVGGFAPSATDAFGRQRMSQPYTLFDSSHRFADNGLWSTVSNVGGAATFNSAQGLVELTVTTAANSEVVRETTKVFPYQPGKALRNGEPVLTPKGWVKIENLKVGDQVFDGLGNITYVIGVYPQGKRKIYRFTFDDGSFVDADEEHLWVTIRRHTSKIFSKGDRHILTTKQMLEQRGSKPSAQNRWRIPCSPVLQIEPKPVQIDPYTMGAILGDGGFSHSYHVNFTTADKEILDYLVCDKITVRDEKRYRYGLCGLSKGLRHYQIGKKKSLEKWVPEEYKFNCEQVRLDTLKGLMDTDGWVERDGCTYFCSVSRQLAEDVAYLARSLGGTARIRTKEKTFYVNKMGVRVECNPAHVVKISIPVNPFRLKRKAEKWRLKWRTSFDRYVYSIQELCEDDATCIRVASNDHTFLTRNHIVTHNSLQIMSTFVFEPVKNNLRQRVGYYGTENGYFLELDSTEGSLCFVERSKVSGLVTEKRISQMGGVYGFGDTGWNTDKLDGLGPSGITLDMSKAQILFMDIEWLGVGTVRLGFVINGQFIVCHQWQHANLITSTYITTASLPMRYEIKNLGSTSSASTLKQICSTVISEGGYELRGTQQAIGTPITTPRTLTVAGTFYPIVALQLKTARLDAIAVLSAISILGGGNNDVFRWELRGNPTVTGGAWVSAGVNSAVEYNLTGTGVSGGKVISSGYIYASNQGSVPVDILKEALFAFQLERDGLIGVPYPIALVVAGANASQIVYGSVDWEEVSR
jgi:hypothetical protein